VKLNSNIANSTFGQFVKKKYYKIDDIDTLIGARLYNCIKENGYCNDIFDEKHTQIENAIKKFAWCSKRDSLIDSPECKYKFIDKFNTNYFIAYTFVDNLWKIDYSLLDRLKDVYNNLPTVLQLSKFNFIKNDLSKNVKSKYTSNVELSVYYKYISQDNFSKILSYIGKWSCKTVTNNKPFSLNIALKYVTSIHSTLSKSDTDSAQLYDLKELQNIITNLMEESKKADRLEKLLANLQVYRIFKERGYCK